MKITEIPAKPKEQKITRVAAYARVSSDKDAAFHSLEAQTEYYEEYVAAHPDWELVSIYSDNGISGTIINRPEFQRMLDDCRAGKVDIVITKSITRFARNTVVLLETVRELKALGIDCYFEKENMHSISPDGELLLTLLAMYAEEEARSASENQKWRIRKKFEKGEPWVGNMLGYRLVDGKMVVVPEEAEIVKQIFADYLSGMGTGAIVKKLNREITPPNGSVKWNRFAISKMLRNEKYAGNMLLQKTYLDDFRSKKKMINHGERRQYYIENSHEAIISMELFAAVQQEIKRRQGEYAAVMEKSRSTNQYRNAEHDTPMFKGMLFCGICGRKYIRKIANPKSHPNPIWLCTEYSIFGKEACPSSRVPESVLIEQTKKVLGIDEINREIIEERITRIEVPEHKSLRFILKDGFVSNAQWEYKSRSLSWTPEMREIARKRNLENVKKERENHAKDNDY